MKGHTILTLQQGRRKNAAAGEPIHCPFVTLVGTKTFFRRGQLSLIAGGPGTGKSAFIQAWLQRGDDHGNKNSVFYFSADSDSFTMNKRAAAIATGFTQDDVEEMLARGESAGIDAAVAQEASHMWWDYEPAPDAEHIEMELAAFYEVHGEWPEVVVLDNAKNAFIGNAVGEFEALEQTMEFLHTLARDTNCAVVVLHHVAGENNENGMVPIPLTGVRGRVTKTPEVVLTLHRAEGKLNISPVKNRNGKAQASGLWFLQLSTDLSRMSYSG